MNQYIQSAFLFFAILLVAGISAAPTQAQYAKIKILGINHNTKTVRVEGVLYNCFYQGAWTFEWGDGSEVSVSGNWLRERSHPYASWKTYTLKLSYNCSGFGDKTYSKNVTLVEPTATPTATDTTTPLPTNTPEPTPTTELTLSFVEDWTGYFNGRIYIRTRTSIPAATIRCSFSGALSGSIDCPSGALVSAPVSGCGTVTITAGASFGGQKVSAKKDVEAPCAPTETPTPPTVGAAYIAVASQNDLSKFVTAKITNSGCTGVDTPPWRIAWGDDKFTDVASPYFGQKDHTYDDWGVYELLLAYTCDGGERTIAEAIVALEHPTPTHSATPIRVITVPDQATPRARGESSEDSRPGAAAPYPTQDHSCLPDGAIVTSDSPWIQFCEVSGDAISDPTVRGAARSAIDVWGPLGVDAEVCFAGTGALLLLDAAYAPRTILPWPSYSWAGKTCARLDRAGTLVLIPGSPSVVVTPTATLRPSPSATPARDPFMIADSKDLVKPLVNCQIGSLYTLNFRESPAGPIMRWFNGVANALARTPNWFQVVDHGEVGWISAHYVSTSGDCG